MIIVCIEELREKRENLHVADSLRKKNKKNEKACCIANELYNYYFSDRREVVCVNHVDGWMESKNVSKEEKTIMMLRVKIRRK